MPIPSNPSHSIIDSSKISTYLRCPRRYFYEYLLGWRETRPSNDLVFGSAWHKAMEVFLAQGYDKIEEAFGAFMEEYRREFPEETDELFPNKNPSTAIRALIEYQMRYQLEDEGEEVEYIEISGKVALPEERSISFRMDSIIKNSHGFYFSRDHKTKGGDFNRMWRDSFLLGIQTGTYTHALYCLFPIDKVLGVQFSGVAIKSLKSGPRISFERVDAWKSPSQMNVWLSTVMSVFDQIESDMEMLLTSDESDNVLIPFPLNPTSCTDFFGCPYHSFCLSWSNPLRHCFEPPPGYEERFWNPLEEQSLGLPIVPTRVDPKKVGVKMNLSPYDQNVNEGRE